MQGLREHLHCMLDIICDDPTITVLSIDPGTNTLGLSVIEFNPITKSRRILTSTTLIGTQLSKKDYSIKDLIFDNVPNKQQRLRALTNNIYGKLDQYKPDIVVAESNFLKRGKVNAFEALVESLCAIREALNKYDDRLTLQIIRPNEAKRLVGTTVKKGMTKDDAKDAVIKFIKTNKIDVSDVVLDDLSEHAIDSLVVGLGFIEVMTDVQNN